MMLDTLTRTAYNSSPAHPYVKCYHTYEYVYRTFEDHRSVYDHLSCNTYRTWPIVMCLKISISVCLLLVIVNTNAFVKRDAPSKQPDILASFQKNMDQFRRCLDQSLAMAVGDVNENQLKPVFTVLGDSINRFSKAFEDLTATTKRSNPDLDF